MALISHAPYYPVTIRSRIACKSVRKGRGIVAVVHSRQVATVRESSDCNLQFRLSQDFGIWTVETGGRSMQVVIKTGITVSLIKVRQEKEAL